jgi:methionyl-tRNA synthetase
MTAFVKGSSQSLGTFGINLPESVGAETFYLSTAISYMNGYPHIGHAYEFISSDAITRLHRFLGKDCLFVTGADEHGQKVEAAAEKKGLHPQLHCDHYVESFQKLNKLLGISNDDYVRTTEERHKILAKKLWTMCANSDDIYLHYHEGWYNEREECYVTETDALLTEYKDPATGIEYKRIKEESYFFKMSKYAERLITAIDENPHLVEPEGARNELMARLRHPDGLRDVCISRTTFKWGIQVPEGFDEKHIMYVWFDALSNYLTGAGGLDPENEMSRYWPCNKHIIGKDIKWFHCVIWPTMLMSAGVPLFHSVFAHGFVNAADGRKMSKSFNNTIDPNEIMSKYPLDSVRYYMLSAATYGSDLNFSEPGLITMHNSELADVLGNLVHRVLNLTHKYCGGVIPDTQHDSAFALPFDFKALMEEMPDIAKDCQLNVLAFKGMEAVRATNKFLTDTEPWKMKGDDEARRAPVVRTTLEALYAFSHFLAPIMPYATEKIFTKLGTQPKAMGSLKDDFYNLVPGTPVTIGDILFTKLLTEEEKEAAAGGGDGKPKAVVGMGVKAKAKAAAEKEDPNQAAFTKMEIRVGEITKVWNHSTADKLFCEEINLGTDIGTREVASGLRSHYSLEDMEKRRVLVVCNLKPAKMVGFESAGMVLAAKSEDGSKVELVSPPEGAEIGELVYIDGVTGEPWAANKVTKKKIWNTVTPDLKTDDSCVATWEGKPLLTSAGPCTVPSLTAAPIS